MFGQCMQLTKSVIQGTYKTTHCVFTQEVKVHFRIKIVKCKKTKDILGNVLLRYFFENLSSCI